MYKATLIKYSYISNIYKISQEKEKERRRRREKLFNFSNKKWD